MYHPTTSIPQDSIESRMMRSLLTSLDDQFKKLTEKIVANAKEQFENELRAKLGTVAINLASYYSVERSAGELIIRVQIEGKK